MIIFIVFFGRNKHSKIKLKWFFIHDNLQNNGSLPDALGSFITPKPLPALQLPLNLYKNMFGRKAPL